MRGHRSLVECHVCTACMRHSLGSMPVHILHLGSPAGLYGAERWILALVKHLDRGKIRSTVAVIKDAPDSKMLLCREAEKLGVPTCFFEANGKFNFAAVRQLRHFISRNGVQILHTHWYKTDIIGLLATVGTRCRIVTTPHGWSREPDFKLWCYEMLDRAVFPFFNAVVPLSEDLYRPLKRFPGMKDRLHLIRNGVDISEIDAVTELAPEIVNLRTQGTFVIGYIGQLIHRKGLDILLEAAARLPKSLNWHLVVIGDGKQRSDLEKRAVRTGIANRVQFLGYRPDRIGLLKGFHVFVLPSRLEGIPRCLMEAMAARVPVISSDIPGCNNLVVHKKTGLLFPMDDAQSLTERIEELAGDKTLRDSLSRAAREFVEQKFSAERMAREYESLYLGLSSSTTCQ